MQQDGLLTFEGGRLMLAPEGLPLARVVASVFDTYLRDSTARHSVAVQTATFRGDSTRL
jgi:oxygen-independent coproporphyrinogen-3 oxidase